MGRGDCSQDGFKITVELSSVNRKQSEMSVNLPRGDGDARGGKFRDVINRYIFARDVWTVPCALAFGDKQTPPPGCI